MILIISEDRLITAAVDEGGRREVYNHVQLVLLHILSSQPFSCVNGLFVAIICFAELVNPSFTSAVKQIVETRFSFTDPVKCFSLLLYCVYQPLIDFCDCLSQNLHLSAFY